MQTVTRNKLPVIDFHSHILPGIDDGSRSPEMTRAMLQAAKEQSVDVMVATPHFYAGSMDLERFLADRAKALESVQQPEAEGFPKLICGAEVAFFPGIGRADGMERLQLEGTNLLLLEMPFDSWSQYDLYEIELLIRRGIRPIIAHLERFYSFRNNRGMIRELLELPVLIQINAEALLSWRSSRIVFPLWKHGQAHLLGSDCHNTSGRPQNLQSGRAVLAQKLGEQCLHEIDALGARLLHL